MSQAANFAHKNAVRITTRTDKTVEPYQGLIGLEIAFNYNSGIFLTSGGDFLPAINPFSDTASPAINYACPKTDDGFELLAASNPSEVGNLEQYLYWVCSVLYASLPLNNSVILFEFLEENSTGAVARFKINLPFDYSKWISERNLVCSVFRTIQTYVYPANSLQLSVSMGNNLAMNNLALMGN